MAINRKVAIKWDGVEYSVKITMELIDQLDDAINLIQMVQEVQSGDIRITKMSKLFTVLLNAAGAEVTRESVQYALLGAGELNVEDTQHMLAGIFAAIFPEPKKKTTTPSKRKAAKKAAA